MIETVEQLNQFKNKRDVQDHLLTEYGIVYTAFVDDYIRNFRNKHLSLYCGLVSYVLLNHGVFCNTKFSFDTQCYDVYFNETKVASYSIEWVKKFGYNKLLDSINETILRSY